MAADKAKAALLAEKLARLSEAYRSALPRELTRMKALAEGLCGGEVDRAALEELHHGLHKLAGSGGTFGMATLTSRSRALEQRVKQWLDGALEAVAADARQALRQEVAALTEAASADNPTPLLANAHADEVAVDAQGGAVWLVEDDLPLAQELKQQLESFGYQVSIFERIADAEIAAQTRRPDMLIMDVMFPLQNENATEVLGLRPTLRALGCPLLFVSSNDDFESRARAARLGAEGYFIKPLDVPRLVSRMTQILDKGRAPPKRVLIVDDDVALSTHYQLTLLAAGMEVSLLHEPRRIVETVSAFRPELVLMDLHMPDYSGPELAGVIRQHDRWDGLPIVYLSAETDIDQQIAAMGRGADDFLTKPISDAHLVAAVRARIERARQLEAQITRDSLTGLLKHASIKDALEIEVLRARRVGKPVAVAMLDIDFFKKVNDGHGHAMGDVVISSVAMLLRQRLRQSDIVGRYGGEEFVAVLPECDLSSARVLLEDIRQRFSAVIFNHNGATFNCTLSAGLASSAQFGQASGAELLILADEALYAAKHGGRNQVRSAAPNNEAVEGR
jgi:diguanylate cyclase (GGDEF)-like protein